MSHDPDDVPTAAAVAAACFALALVLMLGLILWRAVG
jgi:hypothetical protein